MKTFEYDPTQDDETFSQWDELVLRLWREGWTLVSDEPVSVSGTVETYSLRRIPDDPRVMRPDVEQLALPFEVS